MMRKTAAEDIAAMQDAWQEEKKALQQEAYDEGFQIGFKEGREKVTFRYDFICPTCK